ncbi:hypothetical protein OAL15_04260 [Flavobacteriales bacterium]|nr:hypothetical protein [Flavobacteriales bacterium]
MMKFYREFFKPVLEIGFGIGFYVALAYGLYWLHNDSDPIQRLKSAFNDGDYSQVIRLFEKENGDLTISAIVEQVSVSYLLKEQVKQSQNVIGEYVASEKSNGEKLDVIFDQVKAICDSTEITDIDEYLEFFEYEFPEDPYFLILSAYTNECNGSFNKALEDLHRVYQWETKTYQFVLALACLSLKYENYSLAEEYFSEILEHNRVTNKIIRKMLEGENIDTSDRKRVLSTSGRIPYRFLRYSILAPLTIDQNSLDESKDEAIIVNDHISKLHLLRAFCKFKSAKLDGALEDLKKTKTKKILAIFISGPNCLSKPFTLTIDKDSLIEQVYIGKCNAMN